MPSSSAGGADAQTGQRPSTSNIKYDNASNTDAYGNTNITIKISDSNTNLRNKRNNSNDKNVTDNLTDNDDVTTPFKNGVDESNESRISKRKTRGNIFRNIFCCFKSSQPNNRHSSKSNAPKPRQQQPQPKKNDSFIRAKEFNDLSDTTNQNNTNNLQNLSMNENKNNPISNFQKNNEPNGKNDNYSSNGKNTITIVDNNYNSRNVGKSIYNNNGFTNNNTNINLNNGSDSNNNNLYNYSNQSNDNINLNNHVEKPLLASIHPGKDSGKKCLIIDLDETLVHSSFKQVNNADFIVPVEIDGIVHQVYVLKRPHVDEFLKEMGKLFECVLFTASLAKYADPVADLLDKSNVFGARLFREACVYYRGNYVKDLSRLGRDLNKVIIIDNSPASYIFHPDNAVACTSWFDDMHDTELLDLIPHFEKLAASDSVYSVLKQQSGNNSMNRQHQNNYQQQMYSQQSQNNDENQQVPAQQLQSPLYQQQQVTTNNENQQNPPDYSLNENKILLSIDLMMAKKQQQLQ